VFHSVAQNDVNLLPALPMAMVMAVLGGSRTVYILSVLTIYGFATAVALGVALRKAGARSTPWLLPLVFLLSAPMWRAVFIGYLGIGGVALALAVLAFLMPPPTSAHSPRTMAAAGVLLAVLVLFRRWWGIWAVALCLVVAVDLAWSLMEQRVRRPSKLLKTIAGPAAMALASVVTLLVLAAPVVVHRLTTDYADRFAAYSLDGTGHRIAALVGHYGVVGMLLVFGSVCFVAVRGEHRRVAVQMALLSVLAYALMIQIQDHSPQHWWVYDPSILMLLGLAGDGVIRSMPEKRRAVVVGGLALLGALVTAAVFFPWFACGSRVGFPSDRLRPKVRQDLAEVDRLLTYLDHRFGAGAGKVYVLSSSEILSDQVLAFSNLSMGTDHPSVEGFLNSSHVDRRDGFPTGLLLADAVLVTDPVQIHLPVGEQRVVVEPTRSFHDGTDVARAFIRLPVTFVLDRGVEVSIFERVRPNTAAEVTELGSRLREAYPERPEIFAP
jgi:hypothetical protein